MSADSLPQSKPGPAAVPESQPKARDDKKSLVRSELNLEQNAIFTVSTYREKSREIQIRSVAPTGEITERKVSIGKTVGGVETGVLTTHHFKVYLALLELWEKARKPTADRVHFTTLRVMRQLSMKDSGEEYERLKHWLRELRQIPITFENSFYLPKESKHTNIADLTVLSYLDIFERKYQTKNNSERTRGYGEFRFDDHILESLINNHTHPLRLDVVMEFKKHKDTAILLYTYLDRNLALKDKYEVGLEKLFEHLDLSQRQIRYPSDRKAKIENILKELEGKPLSTGTLSYCRVHKTKDEQGYKLVAHKKQFDALPAASELATKLTTPAAAPKPDDNSPIFTTLLSHGLTEAQAQEFMTVSTQILTLQLDALPYRLERYRRQGKPANEAALLYQSIQQNWTPPKSYWQAKEREEQATRRAEERAQDAARAQLLHAEQERTAQHHAALMAYFATLSPEEQKSIDEQYFPIER